MARTRLKGKNLFVEISGEKFECDLVSFVLSRGDAPSGGTDSVVTFCDASASAAGQVWLADIEAIQSTDATAAAGPGGTPAAIAQSLHTLIWSEAAKPSGGELAFVFAPHNNAAPSEQQPHYTGTLIIPAGAYPSVGGQAGENAFTWSAQYTIKDNLVQKLVA